MTELTTEEIIKIHTDGYLKQLGENVSEAELNTLDFLQRELRSIIEKLSEIPEFTKVCPKHQVETAVEIIKKRLENQLRKEAESE